MNDTAIAWTKVTWNPASGCEKVSAGCKFCYAFTLAEQKRGTVAFPNGFDLTIRPHKLKEPRKLTEPSLIFVNSMSDLFWDKIDDSYRDRIFDVIEACPQHQFQALTKRADGMLRFSMRRSFPENFWAGVTVENEKAMKRIGILRKVKATIRFISAEPLLSPLPGLDLDGIHWVITGGESGRHLYKEDVRRERALVDYVDKRWAPREDRKQWVRDIRDACEKFGSAFFHKQWGGVTGHSAGNELDGRKYEQFPRYAKHGASMANGRLRQLEFV